MISIERKQDIEPRTELLALLLLLRDNMKQLSNLLYIIVVLMTNQDSSKSSISEVRHKPTHDSESLNQAVDRAVNDQNFLNTSINLLADLSFPSSSSLHSSRYE